MHKNTEENIYPVIDTIVLDLNERKKTELIGNDLLFLNYKKNESRLIFKNKFLTAPFALGILYVVEGSSLGGRYILKNVETISGLDKQKGVSYFTGYGTKTGTYWKNFITILTTYEQNNNCGDTIIEGAVYAFESIYNHFRSQNKNED